MRTRKRLALLAAAALWAASAVPALASDSGSIDAQVTVATPCITITDPATGTMDFGTLGFSSGQNASTGNNPLVYANCSSALERIFGQGTDATGSGGSAWDLNDYPTGVPCDQPPNQYKLSIAGTNLNKTAQDMGTLAGNTASGSHPLYITMPCAGSDGASETMSFQVTLTATF